MYIIWHRPQVSVLDVCNGPQLGNEVKEWYIIKCIAKFPDLDGGDSTVKNSKYSDLNIFYCMIFLQKD